MSYIRKFIDTLFSEDRRSEQADKSIIPMDSFEKLCIDINSHHDSEKKRIIVDTDDEE